MSYVTNTLSNLIHQTAFFNLTWGNYLMIAVACVFLYLAIKHGFEPLLLVPIAFGMLLVNIYPDIMLSIEDSSNGVGGLLHYFYLMDEWSILPSLIFLGVGAMTDFGPLIANPISFLMGACRIGVRSQGDADSLIAGLKSLGANVEGIFTHFATADEADDSKFKRQLAFFTDLVNNLVDRPRLVHASNSATSIWHAETVFNAVRLGVVIYGLNPSGSVLDLPYNIRPALSLETALVHVKTLPAGQDVGYGATYTTTADEVIGTIPLGYADGWTRDLQGFHVIVDGQLCPIVGRVSMDQITVRLPKVYPLGTPVTLMGENGGASITATEVAEKRGTINYEVLCLLSDRVPRSYD